MLFAEKPMPDVTESRLIDVAQEKGFRDIEEAVTYALSHAAAAEGGDREE
jgi:hypothetical protein